MGDAQRPVQQTPEQKATTESPPPNELPGEVPGAPGSVELYEVDLTESSFDAFAARMPEVLRQTRGSKRSAMGCSCSNAKKQVQPVSQDEAQASSVEAWSKDETKPEAKPEGTPVAKPTEQPDGQDAQRPVQQTPEQKATTESPPPNELPGEVRGAPGSVELYEVDCVSCFTPQIILGTSCYKNAYFGEPQICRS